jgi:hypothetical protein
MATSDSELKALVRRAVQALKSGPPDALTQVYVDLQLAGIRPNIHVGLRGDQLTSRLKLEWYAGSVLDVIDSESPHARDAIIRALDTFAPETP